MLLGLVPRPTKVLSINSPANNVNLYSAMGSPIYALNAICVINANVTSNTINIPAFKTGNGWPTTSFVYIVNNANIVGANGSTNMGTPGTGGAGGAGSTSDDASGFAGSAGGNGLAGDVGGPGGIALQGDSNTGITLLFNNQNGRIIAGAAGTSPGGLGGGGGGGGGGSNL